jgi:hypothetical protein
MSIPTKFTCRKSLNVQHSKHPKTVKNREGVAAKSGLEIALLRADNAFRQAKWRTLNDMVNSDGWSELPASEQKKRKKEATDRLEEVRDSKKRASELEWRHLVETGQVAGEWSVGEEDGLEVSDDQDSEWEDVELPQDASASIIDPTIRNEIVEIRKRYAHRFQELLDQCEVIGEAREGEYSEFV